jgi:hypothetical protein
MYYDPVPIQVSSDWIPSHMYYILKGRDRKLVNVTPGGSW